MNKLNEVNSYSFPYNDELINALYIFSKDITLGIPPKGHIHLTIRLTGSSIRLTKPELILKQPKEVIEKIVEREVVKYMAGELIAHL